MAAIIAFPLDREPSSTSGAAPQLAVVPSHRRLPAEVYRRRRLAVVAIVVGLVLATISLGRHAGASRTPDAASGGAVSYVVQPGDTLWDIARDLAPGRDPRPVVAALEAEAGGPLLQPGQRLDLPAALLS